MSKEARDWAYSQTLKAPAKPVLVALAEHGEECWPSLPRLAEMTGYDGRTVRRAVQRLEETGLISVEHRPGRSPIFRLKLSTTPVRESGGSESPPGQRVPPPRSESPGRGGRESGDPGQRVPRTVKNRKRTVREPEKEVMELPEWMPKEVWAEFVEQRRKMKAPMTDIAQKRAVKKLEAMRAEGQDIEAVIDQSIVCGWKGLFPVKGAKRQNGGSNFNSSVQALQSLFEDEDGQEDISRGHGVSIGGLFEGSHQRAGGGLLGPVRRTAR